MSRFLRRLPYQKLLKPVDFSQSWSKDEKGTVFETQCTLMSSVWNSWLCSSFHVTPQEWTDWPSVCVFLFDKSKQLTWFIYRMLYMDIYWICLFYDTMYFLNMLYTFLLVFLYVNLYIFNVEPLRVSLFVNKETLTYYLLIYGLQIWCIWWYWRTLVWDWFWCKRSKDNVIELETV